MLRSMIILLGALFILHPFNPAAAQQACGERTKFMNKLEETFAERPIAMGRRRRAPCSRSSPPSTAVGRFSSPCPAV